MTTKPPIGALPLLETAHELLLRWEKPNLKTDSLSELKKDCDVWHREYVRHITHAAMPLDGRDNG